MGRRIKALPKFLPTSSQSGDIIFKDLSLKNAEKAKKAIDDSLRDNRFKHARGHNLRGYSYHALPDRKYSRAKLRLTGNDATIYGCIEDDYNSCETI